jgi:hypothetical protein
MRLTRILWLLASVAVLVITLYLYHPQTARDADLFLVYGMLLLAFPSGFLVAAFIALLAYVEEASGVPLINANYGRGTIVVIWLCFVVAGYLQWFKLLPWLGEKRRARRVNTASRSG